MKRRLSVFIIICMMLCMLIPAIPAEAAAMKMSKTAVSLYLNEDNMTMTSNKIDLNIKNKPANYKSKFNFKWYTENGSIAEVNKAGVVTAKKVGMTRVICDVYRKSNNKRYISVSCIVTVKANADSVKIKNAPIDNEIKIGDEFDFNRTMTAANGGKATDKTEWVSSDENILTIDSQGVATGVEEGTVKISCKTYQSAGTKEIGYTAESDELEIKVVNHITDIKCISYNKIQITMAGNVDSVNTDDIIIKQYSQYRQVKLAVSKVVSEKNVITITTGDKLKDSLYRVTINSGSPISAEVKGEFGEAEVISFTSLEGPANIDTVVEVRLFDANGIDVTEKYDLANLSFEMVQGERYIVKDSENRLHIFCAKPYQSVPFELYYHTYTYDDKGIEKVIARSTVVYNFKEKAPEPEYAPIPEPAGYIVEVKEVTSEGVFEVAFDGLYYISINDSTVKADFAGAMSEYTASPADDDKRNTAQNQLLELFISGCIQLQAFNNGMLINSTPIVNKVILPGNEGKDSIIYNNSDYLEINWLDIICSVGNFRLRFNPKVKIFLDQE